MKQVSPETRSRWQSEQGIALVFTAIALLVLMGFLTFVVDNGIRWVSRAQAQNAADAGALAGAVTRAFDERTDDDPAQGGKTEQAINALVDRHSIGGAAGTVTGRTWSWACPDPAPWPGQCVRVNVFRNGEEGSPPLPRFFGQVIGVTSHGTKATATAIAARANGSTCLKPWVIPDLWEEHVAPADTFDEDGGDIYTPPSSSGPGTGYSTAHIGTALTLKAGNPQQAISPGEFYEMETAPDYEASITGCRITKAIGDTVTTLPGNRVGPTNHGIDALTANGPVIVNIAFFSPAEFYARRRTSGTFELTIVNMMAFEISGRNGNQITGRIVAGPGDIVGGGQPPGGNASMISAIRLIR